MQSAQYTEAKVKYQQVYHLTPENLLPYETMTYPSLQQHWQTHAQRGELFGLSASVAGEMIGFAVAECWTDTEQIQMEFLSLYVLPAYRKHGIDAQLNQRLRQAVQLHKS